MNAIGGEFNEKELIQGLRIGDSSAFKGLYEKYGPRLKAFSSRFNFSLPECEDIVQETFIKIWENRSTVNPDSSFNTFLITIAKHLIYNKLRHLDYCKKYEKDIRSQSQRNTESPADRDLQTLIDKTIMRLPDKCRQVYQKSRIEGYSNDQIATEMNISKSTVENHLNKALKKLREELQRVGYVLFHLLILGISFHGIFKI
ncbi:MAG: RNA polymerase sigma-70 factor [Ginsengibacter sp.]